MCKYAHFVWETKTKYKYENSTFYVLFLFVFLKKICMSVYRKNEEDNYILVYIFNLLWRYYGNPKVPLVDVS